MFSAVFKFNPNHDEKGRFTDALGTDSQVTVLPPNGTRKVPIKSYNKQRLFENYMRRQADWLEEQARLHGHESVQTLLELNPRLFKRLAGKWRDIEVERTAVVKHLKSNFTSLFH